MTIIHKEDFMGIYPISCVESYVLAYLKKCGFPISLLYYQSYISVNHILHDFLKEDNSFTQYAPIRRLQDVAIDLGVLDLQGIYSPRIPVFENLDKEIIIGICKDRFFEIYGKNTWRDDHYIYIKKLDNDQYYYLNNIPLHDKIIDYDELTNIYDDRYITFHYISVNKINRHKLFSEFNRRFKDEMNIKFTLEEQDVKDLEKIRDAIGILKFTRQRVFQFMEALNISRFNWMKTANELYAQLEYMRIRNCYNPSILAEQLPILRYEEYEMQKLLLQHK